MLISIDKKFCYIANTKVASTSMEKTLETVSELHFKGTPGLKHMPLSVVENEIYPLLAKRGLDISRYYKFAVIREPVAWVISWFNYHSMDKFKHNDENHYFGNITFSQYLEKVFSGEIGYISKGQSWRFESDNFKMNKLICLEDLDDTLEELSKKLKMPMKLEKLNVSTKKRITKKDLTEEQRKSIEEFFAKDVTLYKKWIKPKQKSTTKKSIFDIFPFGKKKG